MHLFTDLSPYWDSSDHYHHLIIARTMTLSEAGLAEILKHFSSRVKIAPNKSQSRFMYLGTAVQGFIVAALLV